MTTSGFHPPPTGPGAPSGGDEGGDRTDPERALAEKTALLHEIDHRVKNNLQLVSSLLLLQARHAADPVVRQALRAAQARINAVAIVHRRLFQGEDPQRFDVAAFLRDMVEDLVGGSGRTDIRVKLDLERVDIPAARAAPLALMVSELLGNAIRHAFPDGRPGRIGLNMQRENGHFRIEITDNGVGRGSRDVLPGFGQTIVSLLSAQLRAVCETTDAMPGVRTVIQLPVNGQM